MTSTALDLGANAGAQEVTEIPLIDNHPLAAWTGVFILGSSPSGDTQL